MIDELITSIVKFCNYCRNNGLNVGIKETLDAFEVIKLDLYYQKEMLKYGFRTVLCTSKEEFDKFDKLFENYWSQSGQIVQTVANEKKSFTSVIKKTIPILSNVSQQAMEEEESSDRDLSASAIEQLRKTDFSKITVFQEEQLHYIAEQLWKKMSQRISRRYKRSNRKKQIDIRNTIRENISKGGVPIKLRYKAKKRIKSKLLIFLDVSGSMDKYSFFLLRFIYVLHLYTRKTSTFIFSTRLLNITKLLDASKLNAALLLLEEETNIWSSGTTMGECFFEFNKSYGKKFLSGKPIVMVFSDGLETGEVGQLYNQLTKIKSKAKKLIWITPLLGMQDYQPITKGLTVILPLFDEFTSAHNVDSLLKLEKYLTNVL